MFMLIVSRVGNRNASILYKTIENANAVKSSCLAMLRDHFLMQDRDEHETR
jgi:hypothetical protein